MSGIRTHPLDEGLSRACSLWIIFKPPAYGVALPSREAHALTAGSVVNDLLHRTYFTRPFAESSMQILGPMPPTGLDERDC